MLQLCAPLSVTHGVIETTYKNGRPFALLVWNTSPSNANSTREFTLVIVMAVIPPQADTTAALKELYGTLSKLETAHHEFSSVAVTRYYRNIYIAPLETGNGFESGCQLLWK